MPGQAKNFSPSVILSITFRSARTASPTRFKFSRLTARTAGVVGYCRTFMRALFADLTDSGAAATHYGPGPRATAAAGALLVARG